MASKVGGRKAIGWRLVGWGGAVGILLLPLVAHAPWTMSDYVFAAAAFAIVGATFEMAVKRSGDRWYRCGVAVALATALLLVWINGAVGIIGSEDNPANLMFLAVIAIALAGSVVARFEPRGMARAMGVAAAAQALVGMFALAGKLGANEPPGTVGIEMLIGVFALMWLFSGWLFRRSAKQ